MVKVGSLTVDGAMLVKIGIEEGGRRLRHDVFDADAHTYCDENHQRQTRRCCPPHPRLTQASQQTERCGHLQCAN